MKKKKVLLIAAILLAVCLAGCGNIKEEMAAPQITESGTDNREEKAEEKATPVPMPEPTPEPTPTVEEMYEKEYEYLLHGKKGKKDILGGFNCPYRLLHHADWDDGESYLFRNDYDLNYLYVDSVEGNSFRITEEGNIVSMGNQNKIWGIVDEETEVDTANGTVKIYFSKEPSSTYTNGYGYHAGEIAQFNMGDGIITVCYSYSSDDKSNQNKLEKLLPVLLTPVMAENQTMEVAQNSISVGDGYELTLCDPKIGERNKGGDYMQKETMLPVLGVNLAVWERPFSCVYHNGVVDSIVDSGVGAIPYTYATGCEIFKYKTESMAGPLHSPAEFITIDVDNEHIYNYFFGGRSFFKTEEKVEVETPFGIAKIFFAVKEDVEEPLEEEVAILNNMGNNVIISYYGITNPYDGVYDGKLEELIPKLFE